jgi:hypothetical protein
MRVRSKHAARQLIGVRFSDERPTGFKCEHDCRRRRNGALCGCGDVGIATARDETGDIVDVFHAERQIGDVATLPELQRRASGSDERTGVGRDDYVECPA